MKEIYPHISLKLLLLQELLKHWTVLLKLPLGSIIVLPKIIAHCSDLKVTLFLRKALNCLVCPPPNSSK